MKIAREFGVSYSTLYGRVHDGKQARMARKAPYTALDKYQEEALI
jgi:transposase